MNSLIWLTILCCSSTLVSSQNQPQNIFILAGQSNMAGRGGPDGLEAKDMVPPPQCNPNPRILRFSKAGAWEEARDPLHRDIDIGKKNGVGPGMPFANTLLAKDPSIGVIGLVPCAIGDTALKRWSRGGDLYVTMMERTRAALAGGGVLRGLMWYQGEADSGKMEDATSYKTRFEQFVADVRAELQMPTLPVVQVAINVQLPDYVNTVKALRESQKTANVSNMKTIDAWGLPTVSDKVHLTAESQVKLGQMMADAFLQIAPQ
ncbi:probable carbohydrate esterase At4g34215 [Salvia miltiorrhiza]|uniref:probable carbohydrate esterase At4g34215 n=1 Tax=Salvia miltiorrhiza TaxID=226208 RepID=UPI0025AB79CA|nr:probable carbohydrate esterase At4g34215 [Salvia miltiorrhiza]